MALAVTPEWRERADAPKARATHENVGNEQPGDLIALCRDCDDA
jgi:hypothetical protein